jgi:hypothetical protein
VDIRATTFAASRGGLVIDMARLIHESGREAVEKRLVYRDDLPVLPFCEWEDLPEPAREGRILQARFLLDRRLEIWVLVSLYDQLPPFSAPLTTGDAIPAPGLR